MKNIYITILLAISILVLPSCASKKIPTSTVAYKNHPTECIGTDPAGLLRLRVWGEGKDKDAACENAKKKAVEEVVFNNITAGSSKGNSWPIIDSPSVRENNSKYFAKFFKKGGAYKKYIKAEKPQKDDYFSGNDKIVVRMIVTVDKSGLRNKFVKDKIIK